MVHEQVFWYTLAEPATAPLTENTTADVVIVGGGIAGLTAAQSLSLAGFSVVLLEQDFCGSGASGKSSGFITPDSELGLRDFTTLYGKNKANQLWNIALSGIKIIKENIDQYNISCNYNVQDSLYVANSLSAVDDLAKEYEAQQASTTLYTKDTIQQILGTQKYFGGVRYKNTFGICAYLYCQRMRNVLQQAGVRIFEQSKVERIDSHIVYTARHHVKADYIVVCTDWTLPELNIVPDAIYHAQTFLAVTKPMPDAEIKKIFPTDRLMVWDSDLTYHYFRIIDNNRFLIGGSSVLYTYSKTEKPHSPSMLRNLTAYAQQTFPQVNFDVEYFWPGLIGISKDLVPIAGQDKQRPHVYFVSAAEGLPWAVGLADYVTEKIISGRSDLDDIVAPYKKYAIGSILQHIIGKRLSFVLNNGITKFWSLKS